MRIEQLTMTPCQNCQTELVSDGIVSGQQVRCVHCRHVFCFGREEKLSADRLAWRSFWLGLASMCCIFFTGIPAIYFGVRSLLRMRFTKVRPRDRFAAAAGTVMGGCFGLFGGLFAIASAAIIGVTFYSLEHAKEPSAIQAMFDRSLVAELPSELVPWKGISVLESMYYFDFVDIVDEGARTVRVRIVCHKGVFQQPGGQVNADLKSCRIGEIDYSTPFHAEKLKWTILDEPVEVTKLYYQNTNEPGKVEGTDSENGLADATTLESRKSAAGTVVRYYGLIKQPQLLIGIAVVMQLPQPEMTEDRIRGLFSSVRPAGD